MSAYLPDLQELVRTVQVRTIDLEGVAHIDPLFYVHVSDAEKLLKEIERLRGRLAESTKQAALLARGSNCDKAELLTEIERLRGEVAALTETAYAKTEQLIRERDEAREAARLFWQQAVCCDTVEHRPDQCHKRNTECPAMLELFHRWPWLEEVDAARVDDTTD